jgi:hypothetical protein
MIKKEAIGPLLAIEAIRLLWKRLRDECVFHRWEEFEKKEKHWIEKTRICQKCLKKQAYLIMPKKWVEVPPTMQEKREMKLKELGI